MRGGRGAGAGERSDDGVTAEGLLLAFLNLLRPATHHPPDLNPGLKVSPLRSFTAHCLVHRHQLTHVSLLTVSFQQRHTLVVLIMSVRVKKISETSTPYF